MISKFSLTTRGSSHQFKRERNVSLLKPTSVGFSALIRPLSIIIQKQKSSRLKNMVSSAPLAHNFAARASSESLAPASQSVQEGIKPSASIGSRRAGSLSKLQSSHPSRPQVHTHLLTVGPKEVIGRRARVPFFSSPARAQHRNEHRYI